MIPSDVCELYCESKSLGGEQNVECGDKFLPAGKLTPSRKLDLRENFHVERLMVD